jgi:TIR domain
VTYRYDAFISYSHSADAQLVPELQRLIRRVGEPWYSRGTLRIFRDQTNLQLSESLWGSIEDALEASKSFVLMASPAAAESSWVGREVQFWCQHCSPSSFLYRSDQR